MSTYTSEPGTRLAGRYRLVDQTSSGTGWIYWKATDETLARPVTVLTFASGFPRVIEAVTAARAASRLNDSRFAQVFDVEDADGSAYMVLEWVAGETLIDLLAEGPLDPPRAAALIAEAAQALAAAHRSGQAHLRLNPLSLHWTAGGGVKICGLGIDAALAGALVEPGADPEVCDARDLARLLYAALTGYWPGPPVGVLPPAPTDAVGEVCAPRQVAAGVPAGIDSVTCRALFQQGNRQGPAISTPAEFADALTAVAPPVPPMPAAVFGSGPALGSYQSGGSTDPYPLMNEIGPQATLGTIYRPRHPATERSAVARSIVSVVIVLVLAAIAFGAWAISDGLHHRGPVSSSHQQHSSAPAAPSAVLLTPVSANAFSVRGTSADDPGEANFAIAPSQGHFWHTDFYLNYPAFGRLKPGVGLLLDMGKRVTLSQLNVRFGNSCCAHVNIGIGDSNAPSLNSFTTVATSNNAVGDTTFSTSSKASGRYVLIWITYLPPLTGNEYQAQIYDVTIHGTTA